MNATFIHIATIAFRHEYFEDGKFKSLRVLPSDKTVIRLRTLEMLLKPFEDGVHLFIKQEHQLNVTEEKQPLRFEFICSNPYYINYTELKEFRPSKEFLLYDTKIATYAEGSSEYVLESAIATRESGIEGTLPQPMGILELYPNILMEQFNEHGKSVTYAIEFKARKTYWKYFISQSSTPFLKTLLIKRNNMVADFQHAVEGDTITFTSQKPMALSEKSKDFFQLFRKDTTQNGEDQMLINALPIPSYQNLYPPDNPSYEAYFSHIYIHM